MLQNILKKGDSKDKSASLEIPDELPDLAEDSLPKQASVAQPQQSVPDQLPSLDDNHSLPTQQIKQEKKVDSSPAFHMAEQTNHPAQEVLPEEPNMDLFTPFSEKEKEVEPTEEIAVGRLIKTENLSNRAEFHYEHDDGYFSKLYELVDKHDIIKSKIGSEDLFNKMQTFWQIEDHNDKEGSLYSRKDKLHDELKNELKTLKELEAKWKAQKIMIEQDQRYLEKKELEIKKGISSVKKILKEIKFYETVPKYKRFYLKNGVTIGNLQELLEMLKVIDDNTFGHHVNDTRNDFYNWIKDVVDDPELALKIKDQKERLAVLRSLEDARDGRLYNPQSIEEKHFFVLKDGKFIRNLKELHTALLDMDEDTFQAHVNSEKNHFSDWIKEVFLLEDLAKRVEQIHSRKELADLLSIFI